MLRRVSLSVKHTPSFSSLRTASATVPAGIREGAILSRGLVSTVLLTAESYEKKQVAELRTLLRQRELATNGRKSELIQRLKQSDMQRAGSTLAAAAPNDPSLTKVSKAKTKRVPKGKEAAELAAAKMPAAPLEPGSVSSAGADAEGMPGSSSPSSDAVAPANPPGRPELKTEGVAENFNVKVPFEEPQPHTEQYIPSIKAYVDPMQDYSDSYKDEWHMAHAPRVHALGAGHQELSHVSLFSDAALPTRSSALGDLAADVVPKSVQSSALRAFEGLKTSTHGLLSDVLADLKHLAPGVTRTETVSHARPSVSARRALNDEERKGLWVLLAILGTGFAVGGVANDTASTHEASALAAHSSDAHAAPAYLPPFYQHGGAVVGRGPRKV